MKVLGGGLHSALPSAFSLSDKLMKLGVLLFLTTLYMLDVHEAILVETEARPRLEARYRGQDQDVQFRG